MLCNYGYDVERCFDCPYGNSAHIPEDYEGWTNTVIKDTMVTNTKFFTVSVALIFHESRLAVNVQGAQS